MVSKFLCIKNTVVNSEHIQLVEFDTGDERIIITLKNDKTLFFADCDEDVFDRILKALEVIDVDL